MCGTACYRLPRPCAGDPALSGTVKLRRFTMTFTTFRVCVLVTCQSCQCRVVAVPVERVNRLLDQTPGDSLAITLLYRSRCLFWASCRRTRISWAMHCWSATAPSRPWPKEAPSNAWLTTQLWPRGSRQKRIRYGDVPPRRDASGVPRWIQEATGTQSSHLLGHDAHT